MSHPGAKVEPPPREPLQLDAYTHLEGELWFAKRLGDHGHELVFGGESPTERKQRIRQAIRDAGLEWVTAGKFDGKPLTYAQAFERLYRERL